LSPAAAMIAGTGNSDAGSAGMISVRGSFTNGCTDGCSGIQTGATIAETGGSVKRITTHNLFYGW
jgi:hypothetical protein